MQIAFLFFGFLPVNHNQKIEKLKSIKDYENTCVFYEAPHKLISTLEAMFLVFGNRNIALGRELTKIHEEFIRGSLSNIIEKLPDSIKGEFVIIVEGNLNKTNTELEFLNSLSVEEHYKYYENKGFSKKDIIKQIAKDKNVNKNEIYKLFIN